MQKKSEFNFKTLKGREYLEFESIDGRITVKILDIIHRPIFYLKSEVSET
jgi:hypothetical protein